MAAAARASRRTDPFSAAESGPSYVIASGDSTLRPNHHPSAGSSEAAPAESSSPSSSTSTSWWFRLHREVSTWKCVTVSIHEVDPWLQFNPYIRRGFRHCRLRKREALGSLVLYVHNETFNVVSHAVPALMMVSLLLWPLCLPFTVSSGSSLMDRGSAGPDAASDGRGVFGGRMAAAVATAYEDGRGSGASMRAAVSHQRRDGAASVLSGTANPPPKATARTPPAEVPSWLRGLHGLSDTDGRDSEMTDDADVTPPAYIPQEEATSPRAQLLGGSHRHAAGDAVRSSWLSTFAAVMLYLPLRLLPPSTSFSAGSESSWDAATPRASVTVAARMGFSLTPLILCLLATFLLSCVYHTFMPCCRSRRGYQQLLQCDVTGVLLSIGGSAYAYLACGMPCAGDATRAWATLLVAASTLLCLYVIVLAPMWGVIEDACWWMGRSVQWAVAVVVTAVVEFLTSTSLPQLLSSSGRPAEQPAVQRQQRGHRRDATTHRTQQQQQRQPPRGIYRVLLLWLDQHRHLHWNTTPLTPATHNSTNTTAAAVAPREPIHISARQRALVVGVYCLLHLALYRCCVYPKGTAARGGFTQAVYYHNMSYVWLFLGGAINATRFPEKPVFHWTRRAAKLSRQLAAEEAAAWCEEELRRSSQEERSAPTHTAGSAASSRRASTAAPAASARAEKSGLLDAWWQHRLSLARFMTTYVISGSTLDYIGNSHNIWHVCTMLSGLANVLAVYYDCLEYDLVVCS